jgi:hypothetical protein
MAFGTVLGAFTGTGSELHVAANALLMKRIGLLGKFGALNVGGIMAFATALGKLPIFEIGRVALFTSYQGLLVSGWVVMAVETIQGVAIGRRMGLVVEEDFTGVGVVHAADGLFRSFHRKGGISYNVNQ